jgi:hypothetical protein
MEPALALALVLAGFAAALAATIAKLLADVCAAGADEDVRTGEDPEDPDDPEWVAVDMPAGKIAVARKLPGPFSEEG